MAMASRECGTETASPPSSADKLEEGVRGGGAGRRYINSTLPTPSSSAVLLGVTMGCQSHRCVAPMNAKPHLPQWLVGGGSLDRWTWGGREESATEPITTPHSLGRPLCPL